MVQLVFVLVLYLLQIFATEVTLFLSLHDKFIWSKVVLMHDIASRHHDKEEKLLPTILLDYKSMVAHEFIVRNKKKILKYNLIFSKTKCETIILPVPSLFNILSSTYLIRPEDIYAYWKLTQVPEPKPEPPLDPY